MPINSLLKNETYNCKFGCSFFLQKFPCISRGYREGVKGKEINIEWLARELWRFDLRNIENRERNTGSIKNDRECPVAERAFEQEYEN